MVGAGVHFHLGTVLEGWLTGVQAILLAREWGLCDVAGIKDAIQHTSLQPLCIKQDCPVGVPTVETALGKMAKKSSKLELPISASHRVL